MTTIRHHQQAIRNIEIWIEQNDDPEFVAQQEQQADWHAAEIRRLRERNRAKDQRRRTGPNWERLLERVQTKIDRKERTLDFYRAEIERGRNPHYYRSMMNVVEFDLTVLRARKHETLEQARKAGYAAQ